MSWLDLLLLFLIVSAAAAGDGEFAALLLPTHAIAFTLLVASFAWRAHTRGRGWVLVAMVAVLGPVGSLRALARIDGQSNTRD